LAWLRAEALKSNSFSQITSPEGHANDARRQSGHWLVELAGYS
jgi:hypothetical protein